MNCGKPYGITENRVKREGCFHKAKCFGKERI